MLFYLVGGSTDRDDRHGAVALVVAELRLRAGGDEDGGVREGGVGSGDSAAAHRHDGVQQADHTAVAPGASGRRRRRRRRRPDGPLLSRNALTHDTQTSL